MFNSNSCVICNDSISDPVCRGCYIKQIKILLNDLKMHSLAKENILNRVKKSFPLETLNDIECILCKKDNVAMCRFCFSEIIVRRLRELNLTEDLIENFGYNVIDIRNTYENESIFKNPERD